MYRLFLCTILSLGTAMPAVVHAYGIEPAAPSYAEAASENAQRDVEGNRTAPCTLALTPEIVAMIGLPQDVLRPSRLRKTERMACQTR